MLRGACQFNFFFYILYAYFLIKKMYTWFKHMKINDFSYEITKFYAGHSVKSSVKLKNIWPFYLYRQMKFVPGSRLFFMYDNLF